MTIIRCEFEHPSFGTKTQLRQHFPSF